MIAAIYARKSQEQAGVADAAKSISRQIEGARQFVASKGWTLDERHIFVDDGISGALFASRAEFQRLMRDASNGQFDAVVFYDLDRFGRNGRRSMEALHALADAGIEIWDWSTGQCIDLDSFEGEISAFLKTRFAQQFRDQIRKHTSAAMRKKAEAGHVAGGKTFGYRNLRVSKGEVIRQIDEAEAAVVRQIFERAAAGQGTRGIARSLNQQGIRPPRTTAWSSTTIRTLLARPLYLGEIVYGRSKRCYGRELGRGAHREKGQIAQPEASWIRRAVPELRIIAPDLAARAAAVVGGRRARYLAAVATPGGPVPERGHGKYLLSGGLLKCPCGASFEGRRFGRASRATYVCARARRHPGTCGNRLALPLIETDATVLSLVAGAALSPELIDGLVALVGDDGADDGARLDAERDRLQAEIARLVGSIAAGVPAASVAGAIRAREADLARVEAAIRRPRAAPVDRTRLRAALEQRVADWTTDLRAEPAVARLLLRKLVGPLTLHDERDRPAWVDACPGDPDGVPFEAVMTPGGLLDGLVPLDHSPT